MKKCKGFTLVELLVSLSLLGNIILVTLPMYTHLITTREGFKEDRRAFELLIEYTHHFYKTGEMKSGNITSKGRLYKVNWELEDTYAIVRIEWENIVGQQREEVYYAKIE